MEDYELIIQLEKIEKEINKLKNKIKKRQEKEIKKTEQKLKGGMQRYLLKIFKSNESFEETLAYIEED